MKRIVTALTPSLVFRCFSLFLPLLRTLAEEKRSQNCLRFGTGGLCLYQLLSRIIIFPPSLTTAPRAKKNLANRFAHAMISEHYRDFEHAYVYWIWLRGSASYAIIIGNNIITVFYFSYFIQLCDSRKIHYLTREFRDKLHLKTDIAFVRYRFSCAI